MQIQATLGLDATHAISAKYALRAINTWKLCPALHLMGAERPAFYSEERMPIVAFNVTVRKPSSSVQRGFGGCDSGETMLNAHFVSTVLNDVYGIQVCPKHTLPPHLTDFDLCSFDSNTMIAWLVTACCNLADLKSMRCIEAFALRCSRVTEHGWC